MHALVVLALLASAPDASADRCPRPDVSKPRPWGARSAHGVTAITIRRSACFGTCPVYTYTVHAGGAAEYEGKAHVDHVGRRTGTAPVTLFNELARFAVDSGFMCFNDEYAVPVTDLPSVFVTVTRDGVTKTVRNYGGAGPSALWALAALADEMLRQTRFDDAGAAPSPASPPPPKLRVPATPR